MNVIEGVVLGFAVIGGIVVGRDVMKKLDRDTDYSDATKMAMATGAGSMCVILTPIGALAGATAVGDAAYNLWTKREELRSEIKARWAAQQAKHAGGPKAVA